MSFFHKPAIYIKLLQADSNSDLEKRSQNETESGLGDETIQANPPSSDQPPNQPANKEKRRKKSKSKKSKPNVPDLSADHSTDVAAAPSEVAVSATSETATSEASEATVGPDRPDSMRHRKKTVVIAGDSIVKNIVGAKMSGNDSKHYFIVKPFPGTTISDMEDFVKPLSRRSPDKMVLHVGTNDLRSCTPRFIADSIVNLVTQVKEDSPNTTIGVSAILVRNDNDDLVFKALQANIILKEYCLRNEIPFLNNSNINVKHLNYKGLHLNKEGTSALQQNLLGFVNTISD